MEPDIGKIFTIQVKKEIADRYFGFRKLIEEDKLDLAERIKQHAFILEKRISFDLIRIYFLLHNDELIHDFFQLAGLEQRLFYDPQLIESPVIEQRVFERQTFRGLTRAGRFQNFMLDSYDKLTKNVALYREKREELQQERDIIAEEVALFYKKHDLCAIMEFLRSLGDTCACSGIEGGMEVGMSQSLEEKMRIEPPLPIEAYLPIVPKISPLKNIRRDLKSLAQKAYQQHDQRLLSIFSRKQTANRRHDQSSG